MVLNDKGRPVLIRRPFLADTTMAYNAHGQVAQIAQGQRTTTFVRDALDRVTAITDSLNRTVSIGYDAFNRITSQTFADGRILRYEYDGGDNLISVTPPSRPAHTSIFSSVDLLESSAPPVVEQEGATKYRYNRDRQLTLVTRPDDQTVAFAYDAAGRLATVTSDGATLGYTYDTAGRIASVTNSDGPSLSFGYDGALVTTQSWSGAVTGSVAFTYDDNFRKTAENGVALTYDSDGLLASAGALSLQRDPQSGRLNGSRLGIVNDAWTYDVYGDASTYTVSLNSAQVLRQAYTRDAGGRIAQLVETTGASSTTISYAYDGAGRLVTVTRDGLAVESYGYDANGNRQSGSYDNQDRLIAGANATYRYTKNGELDSKTDASGTTAYTYDAFGNLRSVLLPDGRLLEYVIDARNRRVGKKVNGTLVARWLYADQLRIIAEIDGSGSVTKKFVYASRGNVPDVMIWNGVTYRIVSGYHGSPRYVLESSGGSPVEARTYDSFGNVLSDTFPGLLPFGFAGGLYDADTKLVRLGARDYDPQTGRWTAKDPLGFAGGDSNVYAYSMNDPVNLIDPSGLYAGVDDAVFAGGGAVVGLIGQAIGDLIAGKPSGWEDYTAAALGGAAGGLAMEYTGGLAAGAIGAAVQNATAQALKNLTGQQCGADIRSFGRDVAIGTATGFIPGSKMFKSQQSLFANKVEMFQAGINTRMNTRIAVNMFIGRGEESGLVPGAGAGAAAAGFLNNGILATPGAPCGCGK